MRLLGVLLGEEVLEDLALGDLAGRGARQGRELVEFARNLVEREVGLQELLELADVDGGAVVQAVEAGTGLAAQLVVDADDGGFADARELVDELFDFAR